MKSSIILAAVVMSLVAIVAVPAFADDGYIGSAENPIELNDWGSYSYNHQDGPDWKGWAYVFVKNTSQDPWGDFHFKIFSYDGSDISAVDFRDASMGGMDPISTKTLDDWSIDNDVVGAEMSLYFYSNPVKPGEFVQFQVWTDNTTTMGNFGLQIWPSPVPEPSSMLALSGSILGLAGLAWRRRK